MLFSSRRYTLDQCCLQAAVFANSSDAQSAVRLKSAEFVLHLVPISFRDRYADHNSFLSSISHKFGGVLHSPEADIESIRQLPRTPKHSYWTIVGPRARCHRVSRIGSKFRRMRSTPITKQ